MGVPGVIDVIVISENKAISLHYPEHLGGYLLPHLKIQYRGEDRELKDQIECGIRKYMLRSIPTMDHHRFRT